MRRATFAEKLSRQRETVGMSQSELARRLGISQSAVSSWEAMESEPNDHETVYAIEHHLGLRPGELTKVLWGCQPERPTRRKVDVREAVEADPALDSLGKRVVLAVYREMRERRS